MHRALHHAVTRLRGTGAAIEWVGAVVVPADGRCLCLITAADEADVALAHDCAGLPPTYQHVRAVPEEEPSPAQRTTTTGTTTTSEET